MSLSTIRKAAEHGLIRNEKEVEEILLLLKKEVELNFKYIIMDRIEHLQWCKDRAIEFVDKGDIKQAFASFMSDMNKHPETADHIALQMGAMLLMSGLLSTPHQMSNWILGFN